MASILVIEDDSDIRTAYMYELAKAGAQAIEATDGAEAVKLFEAHHPQAVLLDMLMPGVSGLDFLRQTQIGTNYPDTIVIAMSNIDTPRVIEQAKELGADEYLLKVNCTPKQVADLVIQRLRGITPAAPTQPQS